MNHDSLLGVVYRATAKVQARKAEVHRTIVDATRTLVAEGGFGHATVGAIANRAEVATGTLYRYFPSKAELFAEVFRHCSGHEVDVMAAAGRGHGTAVERLERCIRTFANRAIAGRRLAWALIAEPAMPEIEAERLVYRRAYARVLLDLIARGCREGTMDVRAPELAAAALVGALGEALVGPLAPDSDPERASDVIDPLVDLCIKALGATPSERNDECRPLALP